MAMNVTRKEFDDLSNKVDKLGSDVKSSYTAIGNALAGIEDHNSRLKWTPASPGKTPTRLDWNHAWMQPQTDSMRPQFALMLLQLG
jgi:hypothetical protein